jgi:2-polyprenyl-6-methoxyphenol hydroxylase-like FAD-dependent oxidoreductase
VKTLVVGAGIAGLTLGGLLCRQDRSPVIVERSGSADDGYAIGLYPLGSCVLHGLGAYAKLAARSLVLERYELATGSGRVLQSLDMSVLTGAVGPLLMVSRRDLVDILEACCAAADLRRCVTVSSLTQHGGAVEVEFSDGTSGRFDAVVACDGMSSLTRERVFGPATGFDTGWALWTWWTAGGGFDPQVAREWCGPGWFFGVYPAPGRVMCAAGGPAGVGGGDDPGPALRSCLAGLAGRNPAVAAALSDLGPAYKWPMSDVRASRWVRGRVALCGDAAAGFLPAAGVGASNAMRAAAGLADELSRADAVTVSLALELYQKRCRNVIERNQAESRRLARAMFVTNPLLARARDRIAGRYPAERALGHIIGSAHKPF